MKKSLFENIRNNLNESKKDYSEIIDFFIDNIEDIESNGGHLESFIQTLINNDCLNIENIKDLKVMMVNVVMSMMVSINKKGEQYVYFKRKS